MGKFRWVVSEVAAGGRQLTWQGTERALWVHLGLNGDDTLPLSSPALLALGSNSEHIGVVGQEIFDHH